MTDIPQNASKNIHPSIHPSIHPPLLIRNRKFLKLGIQRLRPRVHQRLLTPRQRHRVRFLHQVALKERALHLRHGEIPVGRVLFEKGLVAEEAADPATEDDAAPVADGAAEGHPARGDGVGVAAVLDL